MLKFFFSLLIAGNLQPGPNDNTNYLASLAAPEINQETSDFSSLELITVAPPPPKLDSEKKPAIGASSSLIIDVNSGSFLDGKSFREKRQIASLTKLMTAIIIVEENDPEAIVTISEEATETDGVKIWLYSGEKITVKNLLKGLLIPSASDAAIALAKYNAGQVLSFVQKMNNKAQLLGLKNTHFSNPIGFDNTNNYSTAEDLSILGLYALKNNLIREIVSTKETEIASTNGKTIHKLESTNKLLSMELPFKVSGVKTGYTTGAGYCLMSVAENNTGQKIMTIVLNSPARFTETEKLLRWALNPNPTSP